MITLEEQLKEQIKNNGYSMYSLSKKSGINQTTLQRALNGERPISRENFDRIISYLRLTPVEQKKLENAYTISKIGEPGYKKITFIKNLLEMKPKNTTPIHYDKNLKTAPIKMAFPKSKFDIFISDISNKNFSQNEKIKICKRILAFNQHNIQKYIILQDAIFNINLGVVMNDDESITFYTTDSTDSNIQMCTLYEPTITRSFDCFFANMITLNYAYSPEDTNKLIISAIHKLQ